MILMHTLSNLPLPYPASTKFVPISSFSEKNITNMQEVVRHPIFLHADGFQLCKIKIPA